MPEALREVSTNQSQAMEKSAEKVPVVFVCVISRIDIAIDIEFYFRFRILSVKYMIGFVKNA